MAVRNLARPTKIAGQIGKGTTARELDIEGRARRRRVGSLVCIDQADVEFARRCRGARIQYVDITAGWAFLRALEALDPVTRHAEATGILSLGLAPGLTNLLAAGLARRTGPLVRLDFDPTRP